MKKLILLASIVLTLPLLAQWTSERVPATRKWECVRETGERIPTNYISKSYATAVCTAFSAYEMLFGYASAAPSPVAPVAITSISGGTVGEAADGDAVYSDVGAKWGDDSASYAPEFNGVPTIRTQHADRATTGNTTRVSFTIDTPAQLCVLHPDSVVAKPTWLTGTYVDIGYVGELQQHAAKFFCVPAAAGAKTMGGNCLSACEDLLSPMYSVHVVPAWRAVPAVTAPGPDSEGTYSFTAPAVTNQDSAPFQRGTTVRGVSTVGAASVEVVVTGGTAVAGTDYVALGTPAATYTWADGVGGNDCCVDITPIGAGVSGGETIIFGFANPSTGFTVGANAVLTVTLLDSATDTIAFSAASFTCNEQSVCTGTATRTNADGSTASANLSEGANPTCISGLSASVSWSASENGTKNFTANSADIAMACSAGLTLSGASGAALGLAAATFEISLAGGGSPTVLFSDTFESYPLGCFNQVNCQGSEVIFGPGGEWITGSEPNGNSIVANSNPVRSGYGKYMRSQNTKNSGSPGFPAKRSEIHHIGTPYAVEMTSLGGGNYVGETYWYGYVVCVDENDTDPGYGVIVNQFHTDVGTAAPGWALVSSPSSGAGFTSEFYIEASFEPQNGAWAETVVVDLGFDMIGSCWNVIWEVKQDTRLASNGSTGILRLWVGDSSTPRYEWVNKQVTHGPTLYPPYGGDSYQQYFLIGGYQSQWVDGWGQPTDRWDARYDNVIIMDDTGSWAAMDAALDQPDLIP